MKRFLLLGRTGVGKSSLVNSTFGGNPAKTDAYDACTKIVEYFAQGTSWGNITLIDTPGMAESDRNRAYLRMIKRQVDLASVDAAIYVTRLNETRFYPSEKETIAKICNVLGTDVWVRSILVMTFAASVDNAERPKRVDRRWSDVHDYVKQQLPYGWCGFDKVLVVDNVVTGWQPGLESIAKVLSARVGQRR